MLKVVMKSEHPSKTTSLKSNITSPKNINNIFQNFTSTSLGDCKTSK